MYLLINADHRLDKAVWRPSEHFDLRPSGLQPELVVVHCVSLPEGEYGTGAAQRLFTGELDCGEHPSFADLEGVRVAPHVLIDRQGQIEQFVSFDKRAWHAGVSVWRGRSGCNDFSIGVELEGTVAEDYTVPQYRKLIQLVGTLMDAYPRISADAIVGHCDIAPGRKADPGPKFDWLRVVGQVHRHMGA
tara:strand:- start:4210 stop:4776 length:567 start_codon:yes stop_codon:yes gene_type:complete